MPQNDLVQAPAKDQSRGAIRRYEGVSSCDRYDRTVLLLAWVGSSKSVLELGCSTGFISRRLREQHCRVLGVEVDVEAANVARNFCDRVILADLNEPDWARDVGDRFDVILLGDILEHLPQPDRLLRNLRPMLNPAGYMVISLPNVVHWGTRFKIFLGKFDYESVGTLDCTHLRFFTLRTARALIERSGFMVARFHPAIGGRGSGYARPVWQWLADVFPGLFAYQFLFCAAPSEADKE